MAIEIVDLPIENGGSFHSYLVAGWPTPLKKYEFVSWDDDIPIYEMENKTHVPNHQPVM